MLLLGHPRNWYRVGSSLGTLQSCAIAVPYRSTVKLKFRSSGNDRFVISGRPPCKILHIDALIFLTYSFGASRNLATVPCTLFGSRGYRVAQFAFTARSTQEITMRSPSHRLLVFATAFVTGLLFATLGIPDATAQAASSFNTVPVRSPLSTQLSGEPNLLVTVGTNVNVTNEAGAQSETSVAVDPTNPLHVLESVNDLTNTAAVWESVDGGATWTNSNLTTNGAFCYDTWLAFNTNGDSFVSFECSDQRVAYKLAGTSTWVATKLTNAGSAPDRDMITIDNASGSPFFGSAYIGYDDNGRNNTPYVLYSRDGKTGWTRSAAIPHGNPTIGVNVSTGPDGSVYACWEDYSGQKLWCSKSSDGAATFGAAVLVTTYRMNTTGFFVFIPPQNARGILPFPMTAVAPAGGHHAG